MAEIQEVAETQNKVVIVISMLLALLLFIFAIDLMTVSLTNINNQVASEIFTAANNPFVGLFIGLLMTALVQSSSTVTAIIVAIVASGSLSLVQAVPLIMGANIGTTITSTLVSFSFIMKKSEYKKALSAGVLHDLFNIFTVLILLPLEFYFGFLSHSATYLASFFSSDAAFEGRYTYNVIFLRPLTLYVLNLVGLPVISLILAIALLFGSIKILSSVVYKTFVSVNFSKISKHIFKIPFRAFAYGVFFTAAVQSSTVTTSLIVPLVATRKVSLVRVFPFIIGANIGTTITAAIAAIYKSEAAISIAIVHFLFNLIGALIFLPFPAIRNIPVKIASYFGKQSVKTRFVGFAYILLTFFIIPFLLIYFNKNEDVSKMEIKVGDKDKSELVIKD